MAGNIRNSEDIFNNLDAQIKRNRAGFSNYNTVRMREAIRYLTPEKLKLFIKIPYLLHINSSQYPGYIDAADCPHGIYNFEKSGFYRLAAKEQLFPKSIIEGYKAKDPSILGLYHIGSLGTFTQSPGSDFDYWVIIDKKQFTNTSYAHLIKKLDEIKKYSRESFEQKVSFFVMDAKEIQNDCYAPYKGEEILTVPKIFLKEEFYRTYLMIAGKIPLWSVLPQDGVDHAAIVRMTAQILPLHNDLIDLGMMSQPQFFDILKGLLWHICKFSSDPIKALIKATLVFSYGFGHQDQRTLLCHTIRQEYASAGVDDYSVDPYKIVFDRILAFHKKNDTDRIHLIKNAIFFRLCGFPNVKMPGEDTPKGQLLTMYIRSWSLKSNQVAKLLSYCSWSESEKLLLEKAIMNRMAQMYNIAIKKDTSSVSFADATEKKNWCILKNKTRQRLRSLDNKIGQCSTFLRKQKISILVFQKVIDGGWRVHAMIKPQKALKQIYRHPDFSGALGWVFANSLYNRHTVTLHFKSDCQLFEATADPIKIDNIYLSFQPIQVLFDESFDQDPVGLKLAVFLYHSSKDKKLCLEKAEIFASNSWGELFSDAVICEKKKDLSEQLSQLSEKVKPYYGKETRLYIYQIAKTFDPDLSYALKRTIEDIGKSARILEDRINRPYLDQL